MSNIKFEQGVQVNRAAFGNVRADGSVIHGTYGKAIGLIDGIHWMYMRTIHIKDMDPTAFLEPPFTDVVLFLRFEDLTY